MERTEIIHFIKKFWLYWVLGLVLGAVLGLVIVKSSKSTYEAVLTYEFAEAPGATANAAFYEYDHYYALEAANRLMANFSAWIKTPQAIYSIYGDSGISLEGQTADGLQQFVRVVDERSNTLTIAFRKLSTTADAERVAAAADAYQKANFPRPDGLVISAEPALILGTALPQPFVIGVTALAVFVLMFSLTLIAQYFTGVKAKS